MEQIGLNNNKLNIKIARPKSVYNGPRFDTTAIITSIKYEGHSFCQLEQKEISKGSGGIGFCNEFGIDKPINYETTSIGESFPKIGVGMLTKDSNEPYDFFAYADVKSSEIIEEYSTEDMYKVSSVIKDSNGYNIMLSKTISIVGNNLSISYFLENRGTKDIITNEYNHNFIGIDDDNIGKNYELYLPSASNVKKVVGDFQVTQYNNGSIINWSKEPDGDFYAHIVLGKKTEKFNWELRHIPSKVGVRESSTFPISKIALWGFTHVVCPELFIDINLKSNESMSWTRMYEFIRLS